MKNKIFFLTIIIFFMGLFFIIDIEGIEDLNNSMSIKHVKNISNKEFQKIKKDRRQANYDLLNIKYKDNEVPYDTGKNTYYICYYDNKYDFELFFSDNTTIKTVENTNKNNIKIIAYNQKKYKIYDISLTEFPIINIDISGKKKNNELITTKYTQGKVNIFDNIQVENKLNVVNETAQFKIRGVSSQSYDKKSYSIQLIDSKSGQKKLVNNVLGFKNNNTFALNSLYEDDSKIRDALSLNTWKKINNKKTNDINMKYVEVFINNRYYGLYGFSEVINEYTLDVQGQDAEIYKINNHNVPKLNTFNNDLLVNDSIEIVYPKSAKNANWEPIKNLIKLNYYSNDQVFEENILKYIDIDNCVDYFILCELTYNADGLWKNNVFKYIKSTKKMLKIPWDFDLAWGACWDGTNELMVNYNIETSENLLVENKDKNLSGYLEQRLWQNNVGNFRQKVAKRWKELRSGFLETESFVNYANSLYDEVTESGAREREHERWPDGGYSTDNSFIEKFIRQRLPYLDSQFLQYLDDSGEN